MLEKPARGKADVLKDEPCHVDQEMVDGIKPVALSCAGPAAQGQRAGTFPDPTSLGSVVVCGVDGVCPFRFSNWPLCDVAGYDMSASNCLDWGGSGVRMPMK